MKKMFLGTLVFGAVIDATATSAFAETRGVLSIPKFVKEYAAQ